MNVIALSFADGTTFFVGAVLVAFGVGLLIRIRRRLVRSALSVLTFAGVFLVLASGTPLPLAVYVCWTVLVVVGIAVLNRSSPPAKYAAAIPAVLAVFTVGLCFVEGVRHLQPSLPVPEKTTIYVIGDSISAGTGTKERCWPEVLAEISRREVINLAHPGAKTKDALIQAERVAQPDSLVIVEIGGNDLLGGTDAETFHRQLEELVSGLHEAGHQILLVELPLFPFQNAFGAAQRSVADRYGAALLPKRCFTRVLGTDDGTLDGLHLSQAGHDTMARIVAEVLRDAAAK